MAGPDGLTLRYAAAGTASNVRVAALSAPNRADNLWKTTCFEAFIGSAGGPAYYEFNFSPSTEWAAYRFSDYREGMAAAEDADEPSIQTRLSAARLELSARIDLGALDLPKGANLRIGVAAVIEETNGALSYWALGHPRGKPDFHHADGFVLDLKRKS